MKPWGFKATIFLALLVSLVVISSVSADTAITDVYEINGSDTYYYLNNNITCSSGNAILINCSNVVLDGNGFYLNGNNSANYGIYIFNCENVTVKNVNVEDFKQQGIFLESSNYNTIINNNASNNINYGICIMDSTNNNIVGNEISSNLRGIGLLRSEYNDLTKNTVEMNTYGIYLMSANNNITKNTISSNEDGVYLSKGALNNSIANNTISSNEDGISITYLCSNNIMAGNNILLNDNGVILLSDSYNNSIKNNIISKNNNSGITIENSDYNIVIDNTISSNKEKGIYLMGSSTNNITNNTISSNTKYGIFITSKDYRQSSDNILTKNTISSNTKYGIYIFPAYNTQIYNNTFNNMQNAFSYNNQNDWNTSKENGGGNYWLTPKHKGWSETTADMDGDGFCDSPRIVLLGGDKDYLPLLWDKTAPEVTVNCPNNTIYWENSVLVNVSVTDKLSAISSVIAEIDGVKNITLTVDGDYFTGNAENLSNGNHIIRIIANDTAGNVNSAETVEFEISIIKEYDLLNENGDSFGIITVNARGDLLYFNYNLTESGWIISELHLMALNESPENITGAWCEYLTKKGNPKVGLFEISESGINSATYFGTFNLSEYVDDPLDTLYISAHAKICDENSSECMDLWIDGNNFPWAGWATYVEYP